MINIIEIYPYYHMHSNKIHAYAVHIGKGHDVGIYMDHKNCVFCEVVETKNQIQNAINYIKKLPDYYRNKKESIALLKKYKYTFCK
jgi:hypothetical protein